MSGPRTKTIAGNKIQIRRNLVNPPSQGKTEEIMEEAVAKQVAGMLIMGTSVTNIAKELGLTAPNVRAIKASHLCRKFIQEIGENALAGVKANIQKEIASRVGKAFKVIDHHLDNNTLKAAEHVFRMAGVLEPAAESGEDRGDIIINMPAPTSAPKQVNDYTPEFTVTVPKENK